MLFWLVHYEMTVLHLQLQNGQSHDSRWVRNCRRWPEVWVWPFTAAFQENTDGTHQKAIDDWRFSFAIKLLPLASPMKKLNTFQLQYHEWSRFQFSECHAFWCLIRNTPERSCQGRNWTVWSRTTCFARTISYPRWVLGPSINQSINVPLICAFPW